MMIFKTKCINLKTSNNWVWNNKSITPSPKYTDIFTTKTPLNMLLL